MSAIIYKIHKHTHTSSSMYAFIIFRPLNLNQETIIYVTVTHFAAAIARIYFETIFNNLRKF